MTNPSDNSIGPNGPDLPEAATGILRRKFAIELGGDRKEFERLRSEDAKAVLAKFPKEIESAPGQPMPDT